MRSRASRSNGANKQKISRDDRSQQVSARGKLTAILAVCACVFEMVARSRLSLLRLAAARKRKREHECRS